jgi:hypothetical protein
MKQLLLTIWLMGLSCLVQAQFSASMNSTGVACFGQSNGTAITLPNGGTAPFTYRWSNGGTTSTITGLASGVYSVTITDAQARTATGSITVGQPGPIGLFIGASYETCAGSKDAHASVNESGGTPPFTFRWSNGGTGNVISKIGVGTYTVTATDSKGCTATASKDVELNPEGVWIMTMPMDVTCPGGGNGSISASALNGVLPYTYRWSNGATTSTISNIPAGSYTVTVTDVNGCFNSFGTTISEPPAINLNISSSPAPNGSATASATGGNGGFTYRWSNNATSPSISNLVAGTYNVTATDSKGCTKTGSVTITGTVVNPPNLEITVTPTPTICGLVNGTASLTITGGTPPFVIAWSVPNAGTGTTINNVPAGTYTVTVTDATGQVRTRNFTINSSVSVSATASATPVGCVANTGTATAQGVGGTAPYTYRWDNGAITARQTNLPTGTYRVTVTDAAGCTATASSTVGMISNTVTCSASVTSSYNGANISTIGGSDGSATATASGGRAPYIFIWSNGANTASISGLTAGTYGVTITDSDGCNCTSSVTLVDPAKIGDYTWIDTNKNGIQDPTESPISGVVVTLSREGGPSPFSLTSSTDATGMYMFTVAPGTYRINFATPLGYGATQPNAGTNDALDSDADVTTGMTGNYTLTSGQYNQTVDAGFFRCISVGDFVWFDNDLDGIQDPGENGVANVSVNLVKSGPDGRYNTIDDIIISTTTTNSSGAYRFPCVENGEYIICFGNLPTGYAFTTKDATPSGGNDANDSDANENGCTDPFFVGSAGIDIVIIDAGIRIPCINATSGGKIGNDQTVCQGITPTPLVSLVGPSGGNVNQPFEYLWLSSPNPTAQLINWTMLPNSNSPTYSPGPLTQTTYFLRCSRRKGCSDYVESTLVKITVNNCFVNPIVNLTANALNTSDVMVTWSSTAKGNEIDYVIEKSRDGKDFYSVKMLKNNRNGIENYDWMDVAPVQGMNYYKIKVYLNGVHLSTSQIVQVMLKRDPTGSISVFPNPAKENLNIVSSRGYDQNVVLDIYNVMGQKVQTLQYGTNYIINDDLNVSNLEPGAYLIRVTYGEGNKTETLKFIKE